MAFLGQLGDEVSMSFRDFLVVLVVVVVVV
jgi:hypothetical protein